MSHGPHELPRRVLGDDCQECVSRSLDLNGLSQLDDNNLKELAVLADELKLSDLEMGPSAFDASWADFKAVDTLRLAARIVYRSGITEHTAN